jgi:hypothetical protein
MDWNGGSFALNQALPYNAPGDGEPVELSALVILIGNAYWVNVAIGSTSDYIGYFPLNDFTAPMDTFQVGGEVNEQNQQFVGTDLQMGSGYFAGDGYGWAAYHNNSAALAGNWAGASGYASEIWSSNPLMCSTRPTDYGYSMAPGAPPSTVPGNPYFYYGGPLFHRRPRAP